jgi:hypothetical protein
MNMLAGRLSQGQVILAVSGIVLLVATFLPWYGAPGADFKLWDGPTFDIYLAITGVIALTPALLAVSDASEEFSFASAAAFILGVVGAILVIAFLTVDFPDGADRKFGAFIGLAAVIGVAIGGFRALQEETAGEI